MTAKENYSGWWANLPLDDLLRVDNMSIGKN
jgi:hypothetical protein